MYRHNRLYGCGILSFGIGLLVGLWIGGNFWVYCFGFGLAALGCSMLCKK